MQNVICHQKYFYLWYERGNVKFYFYWKSCVNLDLSCTLWLILIRIWLQLARLLDLQYGMAKFTSAGRLTIVSHF